MKSSCLVYITVFVFIGIALSFESTARAQGIDHESMSGESIARELRQSGVGSVYNLRLGPIDLRTDAEVTTSFNDNVNLANQGRLADILITPSVGIHASWHVTDLNTLSLDLQIGYQTYVLHPQYDSILISPESQAQFNFFVGDVSVTLHDGFSYQQDPLQIGQVSNTTQLSRFENDAGFLLSWDLSAFILSMGYDHANLWVSQPAYQYLTNQSDTLSPRISFKLDKTTQTGLEASIGRTTYEQDFQNDNTSLSVGPFVSAQISKNLSVSAQAGGYFTNYDHGGANGDTQNVSSYYANAGVNQRVNDSISQSLTAGREFIPGLTSNFTQRTYVNYTSTWQATSYVSAGANVFYENLEDSNALVRETSNRYGLGLSLNDKVTPSVSLNLNYQYTLKMSDVSSLSYYQNLFTTGLSYQF